MRRKGGRGVVQWALLVLGNLDDGVAPPLTWRGTVLALFRLTQIAYSAIFTDVAT